MELECWGVSFYLWSFHYVTKPYLLAVDRPNIQPICSIISTPRTQWSLCFQTLKRLTEYRLSRVSSPLLFFFQLPIFKPESTLRFPRCPAFEANWALCLFLSCLSWCSNPTVLWNWLKGRKSCTNQPKWRMSSYFSLYLDYDCMEYKRSLGLIPV